jgi:hypothetical protein
MCVRNLTSIIQLKIILHHFFWKGLMDHTDKVVEKRWLGTELNYKFTHKEQVVLKKRGTICWISPLYSNMSSSVDSFSELKGYKYLSDRLRIFTLIIVDVPAKIRIEYLSDSGLERYR